MKLLFTILLLPIFTNALECDTQEKVLSALLQSDYASANLNIFRNQNMDSKNDISCDWEQASMFTYQDEGEPTPAFKIRYYCGKHLGSRAIKFTALCFSEHTSIQSIEFEPRDTQFP